MMLVPSTVLAVLFFSSQERAIATESSPQCRSLRNQCVTSLDLQRRANAVTLACCDQDSEDCSSGAPSTCNAGCAAVLLPFWRDCQTVLGSVDILSGIVSMCQMTAQTTGYSENAAYVLDAEYSGASFADSWYWETIPDPTEGCVRFVNQAEAEATNLAGINQRTGAYELRADSTNVVDSCNGEGRPAIRLTSKKVLHQGGIVSIDLNHMPSGCGTWPAFWLFDASGNQWPVGGEIDVIEGVNLQTRVATTLHTTDQCTMHPSCDEFTQAMTGSLSSIDYDCNAAIDGNAGCQITGEDNTYGEPLNDRGGGVFVVQWEERYIKVWFFTHGDEPSDYVSGTPNPRTWGAPYAAFPLEANCASTHFHDLSIIFDTTFCGAWAGAVYDETCGDQPDACHTATQSSTPRCATAIESLRSDLRSGVTTTGGSCLNVFSTDEEVQAVLFVNDDAAQCPRPCNIDMATACVSQNIQSTETCHDARATDICGVNVNWALTEGLSSHPEWYAGFGNQRTFKAMQAWLHHLGPPNNGGCSLPCGDLSFLTFTAVAPDSGGGPTPHQRCNERVMWEPQQFTEAYWSINHVRVFQRPGLVETCNDGEKNQGESDVDCGGPCENSCTYSGNTGQGACHTYVFGEACYEHVRWAMSEGIYGNPEWYPGLSSQSSWDQFQCSLALGGNVPECSLEPCGSSCSRAIAAEDNCHTVGQGDPCYQHLHWAMTDGIYSNPEWYPGLTAQSSLEQFQCSLSLSPDVPECTDEPCGFDCTDDEGSEDACNTVTAGNPCYTHVTWAMNTGIYDSPEWYPGLTAQSTFEDFQCHLTISNNVPECHEVPCGRSCNGDVAAESTCHTVGPGDPCYTHVAWAMGTGIYDSPEWYPGLTTQSTLEEFQCSLSLGGNIPECTEEPCGFDCTGNQAAEDGCHTVGPGEACFGHVDWAMNYGIDSNPEWYPGLTAESPLEVFQCALALDVNVPECTERPCGFDCTGGRAEIGDQAGH